ncbi:MAG TPA: hypothetical protein VNV62_12275 [Trebonia sp.]|jgi:hypothetical protein|nr:hypothetical protein [Trebonia sp.]
MSLRAIGWIAAGVAGLLAAGGAGAASAATGAHQAAAPHWHIVKSIKTNANGDFTAVVATGKTTAWAFNGFASPGGETAWQRTGSTWKQAAFPGKSTEYVALAAATSPSDVWAFANDVSFSSSRVLRWTGSKWAAVKTFGGNIVGATVLSSKDVWVFGEVQSFVPVIGVWHYNGSTWKQVVKNLGGGSALSDHDVWAFTKTSVEHYNGHKWTATSVKNLLPAVQRGGLNDPQLVGILALSDSDVFAIGSAEAQDEGGPVVVLQYNGHTWVKRATGEFGYGPLDGFSYDGAGGLWLPMDGPIGGTSYLVHYAAGKLTKAALPVNPATITIRSVARIPGTTQQLAGGFTHHSGDRTAIDAVILQYS